MYSSCDSNFNLKNNTISTYLYTHLHSPYMFMAAAPSRRRLMLPSSIVAVAANPAAASAYVLFIVPALSPDAATTPAVAARVQWSSSPVASEGVLVVGAAAGS